jgi:two-component system sensor kinase FixL
LGMFGTIQDVTKIKKAEDRFRNLLESAPDAMLIVDGNGIIQLTNAQTEEVFGYRRKELINSPFDRLFPKVIIKKYPYFKAEKIQDLPHKLNNFHSEIYGEKINGNIFPIDIRMNPIEDDKEILYSVSFRDITDRKNIENALIENQRAMSTLMGNLPGMAYRAKIDRKWTMEFVSQGSYELTGYLPEELIDNKKTAYIDLVLPNDLGGYEGVQSCLREKKPFQFEYKIQDANGNIKWVWEKGGGVYNEEGEAIAIEGFIEDITEMVKAEKRFKNLLNTSPDAMMVVENNKVFMINQSGADLFGHDVKEIIGLGANQLIPDWEELVISKGPKSKSNKQRKPIEVDGKKKSGKKIIIDLEYNKIMVDGRDSLIVALRDISHLKKVEEALKDSKANLENKIRARTKHIERLNITFKKEIVRRIKAQKNSELLTSIVKSHDDAIFSHDLTGFITSWNNGAEKIFGLPEGKVIGTPMVNLLPQANANYWRLISKRLEEGIGIEHFQSTIKSHDGSVKDLAITLSSIKRVNNIPQGVSIIARDLKDAVLELSEKETFNPYEKLKDKEHHELLVIMQKAQNDLERFAYIISHDFKAPLRGITTMVEWIREENEDKLSGDSVNYLKLLVNRSERLTAYLDGILAFSRAGRFMEPATNVDLNQVIGEIKNILVVPKNQKVEFQEDFPMVKGEKIKWVHLFHHLIINAIQNQNNKKLNLITVGHSVSEKGVEFFVQDTGVGIDKKHWEEIFHVFKALKSRDETGRVGVGLAIVKRITELMNGTVHLESEMGKGTRFVMKFDKGILKA